MSEPTEQEWRAQLLAPSLEELRYETLREAVEIAARGAAQRAPVLVDLVPLIHGFGRTEVQLAEDGGLDFVQISSTEVDEDFDSVPPMDAVGLLERLGELERWVLHHGPDEARRQPDGTRGSTRLSKRKRPGEIGAQVLHYDPSGVPPAPDDEDPGVASQLETRCPIERTLGEFRGGVVAVIPPDDLRRRTGPVVTADEEPGFETLLYFRPDAGGRLHEIPGNQRWGLAQAVREITGALRLQLSLLSLDESYDWELEASPRSTALRLWVPHLRQPLPELLEALKTHLGIE